MHTQHFGLRPWLGRVLVSLLGDELRQALPAGPGIPHAPAAPGSSWVGRSRLLDFAQARGPGHDAAPCPGCRRFLPFLVRTPKSAGTGRVLSGTFLGDLAPVCHCHDRCCRPAVICHGLLASSSGMTGEGKRDITTFTSILESGVQIALIK